METNYLDIESLVAPISEQQACGLDLEYDPSFSELERLIQDDKRNRIFLLDNESRTGTTDWEEARNLALNLFKKTKDLRIGVILTKASAHLYGFQGLRDGLALLSQLLKQYWDSLHPLEPDDPEWSSASRISCLEGLLNVGNLRESLWYEIPLVESGTLGSVYLANLAPSSDTRNEFNPVYTTDILREQPAQVARQLDTSNDIETLSRQISNTFEELYGYGKTPASIVEIEEIARSISQYLSPYSKTAEAMESAPKITPAPAFDPAPIANEYRAIDLEITSSDDVRILVDKLCCFYEEREPSSPIPILLRKAEALIGKTFESVLTELQPENNSLIIKLDNSNTLINKKE